MVEARAWVTVEGAKGFISRGVGNREAAHAIDSLQQSAGSRISTCILYRRRVPRASKRPNRMGSAVLAESQHASSFAVVLVLFIILVLVLVVSPWGGSHTATNRGTTTSPEKENENEKEKENECWRDRLT
jgi:hypothetical protein